MAYNPEEIEEILKRYSSGSSSSGSSDEFKTSPEPPVKETVKPEPPVRKTVERWEAVEEPVKKEPKIRLKGSSNQKPDYSDPLFDEDIPVAPRRETISDTLKPESVLRRGSVPDKTQTAGTSSVSLQSKDKLKSDRPADKYEQAEEIDRRISRAEIMKKKDSASAQKAAAERQKKRRRKTIILNTLLVIFILIFLGSGTYLGLYFYKIKTAENTFDDVKKLIKEDSSKNPETGEKTDTDYTSYETIEGKLVQAKYADVYERNPEFIGWLTIPDTNVDYPVMYTPKEEQKYLHLDFDGEYSSSGTLFAAAGANPVKNKDNTIIYGHNMKAGTMFHTLLDYEKEDFYAAHKTFTFNTIYEDGNYEVIAAFRTKIDENDDNTFKYYEFFTADSEAEFNAYVEKAKSLTPYNITETATYGDALLTLSTCAYHTNEGRYVVVAKKVK